MYSKYTRMLGTAEGAGAGFEVSYTALPKYAQDAFEKGWRKITAEDGASKVIYEHISVTTCPTCGQDVK